MPYEKKLAQEHAMELRLWAKKNKLGPTEIARAIGVDRKTVSNWFNPSKNSWPNTYQLRLLAKKNQIKERRISKHCALCSLIKTLPLDTQRGLEFTLLTLINRIEKE